MNDREHQEMQLSLKIPQASPRIPQMKANTLTSREGGYGLEKVGELRTLWWEAMQLKMTEIITDFIIDRIFHSDIVN